MIWGSDWSNFGGKTLDGPAGSDCSGPLPPKKFKSDPTRATGTRSGRDLVENVRLAEMYNLLCGHFFGTPILRALFFDSLVDLGPFRAQIRHFFINDGYNGRF